MIGDTDQSFFVNDEVPTELEDLEIGFEKLREKYRILFTLTDVGRDVLEDISRTCLERDVIFTKDPYSNAFGLGARSVILYIRNMLEQPRVKDDATKRRAN